MEVGAAPSTRQAWESRLLASFFWLVPVAALVLGMRRWLPPLASQHGAGLDLMIKYLLVSVGALLVVGHLLLGYFVWHFGRVERVTYRLASPRTERRWSLVPIAVMSLVTEGGVFALGMPVWQEFYAAAPPANATTVEVTAEQFAWNIRYPGPDGIFGHTDPYLITLDNAVGLAPSDPHARDDIVLSGELVLPVNRPAYILLRSKDVIHNFYVPDLRVKQDVVPGMTIAIWFVPTKVGTYEIACSQLCGMGHFQMRGVLRVLPPEDFERWLKAQTPFLASL